MIARRLLLLVAVIVLLIDDDERQVAHRGKDRRARADRDTGFAAADAVPLLGALGIAERRMQNGNLLAENAVQIGGDARSQSDLRHQQNRATPCGQHRLHGRQIHRGFPDPVTPCSSAT